ncbi:MAG: alpha/beta hydrolase [Bauldia litoralis]
MSTPDYTERRYTSQDGLSLYFRDYGDAASPRLPVLCLPGLTRNSKDFAAVAARLAAERRVVCPDLRGRGRSDHDPNPSNYQPATYVNDIRHLIAVCGLHGVAIIGTSLGGLLAMGLGVAAPGAIAGVVLNDVGPEITPAAAELIIDYVSNDKPQPDFDGALAATRERFAEFDAWDDAALRDVAEATYCLGEDGLWHFDWDTKLAEPLRNGSANHDLWALFGAIRNVPVLAIRGDRSDLLPESGLEAMKREHADLETAVVAGVGHAPRLSEPEATEAIDRFLARLDARRAA